MPYANPPRAARALMLVAPLVATLGCTELARGFPDAAPDLPDAAAPPDAPLRDVADVVDATVSDVPAADVPATDLPVDDVPIPDIAVTDVPPRDVPAADVIDVPVIDVPTADLIDVPVIDGQRTDIPDVPVTDVVDVPAVDRPDAVDAGACDPSVGARLVRPLSGSRVTGRDIQFRWTLPPGATSARLDFCENRACSPASRSESAAGTSLRTGVAGRRWWRVQALQNGAPCGPPSPTWWVLPDARAGDGQPYRVLTDLNGDAVSDALISGQNAAAGAGRLYAFRGSSAGLPATPTQTLSPPVGTSGQYGLPAAGDFNGDGLTDVAVSQTNAGNQYLGRVWSYLSDGSQIGPAPVALAQPAPAYSHFGTFMFAGDFNGDGYTDLAVASGMLDVGAADLDDPQGGRVFVYEGSPAGLATSPATTVVSPGGAGSQFGNSGAVVDLDDDGCDDLLLDLYAGPSRVWVHLRGGASGLSRVTPDIAALAGTPISGGAPSNLGDVTGDGRVDVGAAASVQGTWRALVGSGAGGAGTLGTQGFTIPLADAPTNGNRLVSADVTADGVSDLVLTQVVGGESRVYVYESGRTTAALLATVPALSGQPGFDGPIVIGDYNGDQLLDVLAGHPTAGGGGGAFSLVLGVARGFAATPAGRGVTVSDPSAYLGNRLALRPPARSLRRL